MYPELFRIPWVEVTCNLRSAALDPHQVGEDILSEFTIGCDLADSPNCVGVSIRCFVADALMLRGGSHQRKFGS